MKRGRFTRSMLEYSKIILSKITFDKKLFRKEYRKAFHKLDAEERVTLRRWVRTELRLTNQ
jgi:hypothetical protein